MLDKLHVKDEVLHAFASSIRDREKQYFKIQTELLDAVVQMQGYEFASYFETLLAQFGKTSSIHAGRDQPPSLAKSESATGTLFSKEMEPSHFDVPDPQMALELYNAWRGEFTDEESVKEGVWCHITLNELRKGTIQEPWWLLTKDASQDSSLIRGQVKEAIAGKDDKSAKRRDDFARRIARRFGAGGNKLRGSRSLRSDCSLARIFWVGRIASTIASDSYVAKILASEWKKFAGKAFSGKEDLRAYRMAIYLVLQSRPEVYGDLPIGDQREVA